MGGVSFQDAVTNLKDPAIGWRYQCIFPTITTNGGSLTINSLQLEKVNLPHPTIEANPTYAAATFLHFPKDFAVDGLSFQFYEDTTYSIIKYFALWRSMVVDDSGNYGIPGTGTDGYKRNLQVDLLDHAGNVAISFYYYGCFPVRPAAYMVDPDASTRIYTSVDMSCDRAQVVNINTDPLNANASSANGAQASNTNFNTLTQSA
jgi:hypothetical protein